MGNQKRTTTSRSSAAGTLRLVILAVGLFGAGAAGAQPPPVPGASGESALHWAARFNAVVAIRTLIDGGLDVNAADNDGRTPLHWAAEADAAAAVEALMEAGAGDGPGEPPLVAAARARALGAMEALMARQAGGVERALHAAAAADDAETAQALIAGGADMEARNDEGSTPMEVAAKADAARIINLLVESGVNPLVLDRSLRERPLHMAARANAGNALAALLAHGAYIEILNPDGETPLHAAAGADATAAVEVLLAEGANVLAQDREGRTPLAVAEAEGAEAAATLLRMP